MALAHRVHGALLEAKHWSVARLMCSNTRPCRELLIANRQDKVVLTVQILHFDYQAAARRQEEASGVELDICASIGSAVDVLQVRGDLLVDLTSGTVDSREVVLNHVDCSGVAVERSRTRVDE